MKEASKRTLRRTLAMALVFTMLLGMPGLAALAAPGEAALSEGAQARTLPELKLWYDEPASSTVSGNAVDVWQQAILPIGNGTIGASVYGEIATERLALNEQTLWLGGPSESRSGYIGGNLVNQGLNGERLQDVKNKFAAGNVSAARSAATELKGEVEWGAGGYGYYAPWGDLNIAYNGVSSANEGTYERWLSLDNALAGVEFTSGSVTYNREYLVSHPDKVLAAKLTSTGGSMNLTVSLPGNSASTGTSTTVAKGNDTLALCGALADNQMKFASFLKVVPKDGTVAAGSNGGSLVVTGATEVTLFFAAATDYKQEYPAYRTGESDSSLAARVQEVLDDAVTKGYDAVKASHMADYDSLYGRMTLDLGQGATTRTTDALLAAYNNGTASEAESRLLEVMLFQYGRYLTIASSRQDSQLPSNLQGIWNTRTTDSPWHSDFHTNVNLQMNYWPVYSANLAECADPLVRYIDSLREPGRVTAKIYAGIESTPDNPENGFMAHTQNTPFGWTCPGWSFYWGWAPAAMPWMLQNCWEYYEYTGDLDYMKRNIYPMMKEQVRLYEQLLSDVTNYQNLGYELVNEAGSAPYYASVPAYSPETGPITAGNTFEQTLVWQLIEDTMTAARLLDVDEEKIGDVNTPGSWKYIQAHLLGPIVIGETGQVKEWYHETEFNKDADGNSLGEGYGHRHISHILGLYPGDLIQRKEEWVEAALVSMQNRTFTSTGWGMGQRINTWARLRDGESCHQLIKNLFSRGIYKNLWDAHPPFQIDGNFGYTAGVDEMLMQSNMGFIDLLPALPDAWSSGHVDGLVTRGNFELDMTWSNSALDSVDILSRNGGECVISYPGLARAKINDASGNPIQVNALSGDKVSFQTAKGQTYQITDIPQAEISSVEGGAYRTAVNNVELQWTAESGKTYTIYRQVENGEVLQLATGVSASPYADNTAYETLGRFTYYIAEGTAESTRAIPVQDLRNMARVDDQYSLDGTNNNGSPIVYTGSWGTYNSNSGDYKTTCKFVEARDLNGQTASLVFLGTGIEIRGCSYGTHFNLSIDGGTPEDINAGSQSGRQSVLGKKEGLPFGVHKAVITLVSGKIDFDGFNVLGGGSKDDTTTEELVITTPGNVTTLWAAGDTLQLQANLEGVTWSMTSTFADHPDYPNAPCHHDHAATINANGLVTAGKMTETLTVTATKSGQTATKTITVSPATVVTIVEDNANGVNRTGGSIWTGENNRHHGGTKADNPSQITYTFTGTGIGVFCPNWPNGGNVKITIDGTEKGTYSLYNASDTGHDQSEVAKFTDLGEGSHTIVLDRMSNQLALDFFEVYATNPNAPTVSLTELTAAVASCGNLKEASFTASSWNTLQDALNTAAEILNGTVEATESNVANAISMIASTKAALVPKSLTAPEHIQAIVTEGAAITLKWDKVEMAEKYDVVAKLNGTTVKTVSDLTVALCRVDGLAPGKSYSFTVTAKLGQQSQSGTHEASTLDTEAPAQPKALTYTNNTLSWTAATDNVAVTGYKVLVDGVAQADTTTATSRTLTLTGTHTVQVIALDAAGNESAPASLLIAPEYNVTATGGAAVTGNKSSFKVGEAVEISVAVPKGSILTGWTSADVSLSGTDTTVSFPMPAKDVSVAAHVETKNWPVTLNLTNLTAAGAPTQVGDHMELSLTLQAADPYKLPSSVSVTMGGEELRSTQYHYNATSGAITISEVTGDVVITAENANQTPTGSTFTQADPFLLPGVAEVTAKAEAEYMTPTNATVSNGPGFGNKHLGSFQDGNKVALYYDAPVAGIYTATVNYRSARVASNLHTFGWTGTKVEDYATDSSIENTLNDSGVAVYKTALRQFTVTEAGVGLVEFTVGNVGNDSFDLDWISFELTSQAGPAVTSVTLEPATATVYTNIGDAAHTARLTATVLPAEVADDVQLTWKSSDPTIAAVDNGGTVTARANGQVTITATAPNGVKGTATVNVKTKVTGTVVISGSPKFDETLEASVNQLTPEEARNHLNYQWNRGGEAIDGATNRTYKAVEADIGQQLTVTVTAQDPYVGAQDGTTSPAVTVTKADGPAVVATLGSADCTNEDDTDGMITGLNPDRTYEYKLVSALDEGGNWTTSVGDGTRTTITVPAPGTYHIRVKETDTHFAGPTSRNLTILAHGQSAYDVNVADSFVGGVVRADPRRAQGGATVTLTVTPDAGYQLKAGSLKVTGSSGDIELTGSGPYTFQMPGGDVTVTAEFEKLTCTVTHNIEHATCDLPGTHPHTVPYGETDTIRLTAEEGYDLPETITITRDGGGTFTGYTYRGGVITFTQPITEDLTITGTCTVKPYDVYYRLTGVTAIGQPRTVNHNEALTIQLTAATGYELPDKAGITLTIDGDAYTDFGYTDGAITIAENVIDGDVVVTATGRSVSTGQEVTGVTINGQPIQGKELTAIVTPIQAVVRYQWLWVEEDGTETPISGATNPRYTLSGRDLGKIMKVRITGVLTYSGTATSEAFGPVEEAAVIAVTGVELSQTNVTILAGGSATLNATVLPADATNKTVHWASGNRSVATVNEYGVVSGLSAGTATIIVTTVNGEKTDSCTVNVVNVLLEQTSASVRVGGTVTLNAFVSSLLSSDDVTWTSSDEKVATVDEEGVVTGVSAGTVTITATTVDGNYAAECEVRVTSGGGGGGGGISAPAETTKTETRDDGAKVTTVTKSDGSVIETVEQSDGAKSETVTTKNGDVTITVTDAEGETIATVEIPATAPTMNTRFEDVPAGHWADEAIHRAAALKLVNGVGGNQYDMVSPMTRGALAAVLHRLSQGKTDYNVSFTDVTQGKYYTAGVAWAAKVGVVKGLTEEIFAPDNTITREQLAVMLARYAKLIGLDTKADANRLKVFADGDKTGQWATDGVAWCVQNGILQGKGQNNLDPAANVTRAEVAVMLDRFIDLIK